MPTAQMKKKSPAAKKSPTAATKTKATETAGTMAEFGTTEVLRWVQSVSNFGRKFLVMIEKDTLNGRDVLGWTVQTLSQLLQNSGFQKQWVIGSARMLLATREKRVAAETDMSAAAQKKESPAAAKKTATQTSDQVQSSIVGRRVDVILDGVVFSDISVGLARKPPYGAITVTGLSL